MGLLKDNPEDWFAGPPTEHQNLTTTEIDRLIENRNKARDAKDFKEADRIRDHLREEGILLDDSKRGTKWRRVR